MLAVSDDIHVTCPDILKKATRRMTRITYSAIPPLPVSKKRVAGFLLCFPFSVPIFRDDEFTAGCDAAAVHC